MQRKNSTFLEELNVMHAKICQLVKLHLLRRMYLIKKELEHLLIFVL